MYSVDMNFTKAITKALFAFLFFGALLVLSAHYRVVPYTVTKPEVANPISHCVVNGNNYPTGVVMYGPDNAPHMYTDKIHVERALVDTFGHNGAKPAHVLAINAFCH